MKLINALTEFFNLIKSAPLTAIIMLLILFFSSIILFKKSHYLQTIYNWVMNQIWFIKRENVMLINFSKKTANYSNVKNKYQEQGCLFLESNFNKYVNKDGSIYKNNLLKILKEQKEKMNKAIKRSKNSNSLIYLGFPHVPLAFLDGYHFKDTDNTILFEYQGEDSECLGKGFYELNKKYNTGMQIICNYDKGQVYEDEIALKIVQSFPIMDEDIKKTSKVTQIVTMGIEDPNRWKINNYAQIELYKSTFSELLSKLAYKGVKRVHLYATTPVTLSFSLGSVIDHFHPEVIIYNYNNNAFDWAINLRAEEILTFIE